MRNLGYSVHVLITIREGEGHQNDSGLRELRSMVDRVDLVERAPRFRSLLGLRPSLVARNDTLAAFQLNGEYDMTIAESEHVIPIFDNPLLRTKLRVLRVHNNESKYMWELAHADERLSWKAFFGLEALRYRGYMRVAHEKASFRWFVSQVECPGFGTGEIKTKQTAVWIPPAVSLRDVPERPPKERRRVLFVGGLKNPLNRYGLRWYLQKVHPLLIQNPIYELAIAGNTEGTKPAHDLLKWAQTLGRCSVHPDVSDLGPLYDSCALLINPMRRGAGVKLKTLHAIQRKIPLVTTSTGAEGSGFVHREHIRIEDSARGFADAVLEILQDPESGVAMAKRAYTFLAANYNHEKNIERFLCAHLDIPESSMGDIPMPSLTRS
jgi:glycosyltransferase involved in cell wall biosynthesis